MPRFRDLFGRGRRGDPVELLRVRFEKFRHLLEMNNRILRLIAEANEKLGGEYLFDRQYLKELESGLADAAAAVVHDLNDISDSRYPGLAEALGRVRAAVRAKLEGRGIADDTPLVIRIDGIEPEQGDVLGEKMARLGVVRRLGLAIPDGFVITARASKQLLEQSSLAPRLEALRAGRNDAASEIEAVVSSADIPPDVAKTVKQALTSFERTARFAIRSSAIEEDGDYSFAGQYTTLLNVPRDQVLSAWRTVVASLFSRRAEDYRRSRVLAVPAGGMAVGCLLMVPATSSGVIYTVDPNAPESGALIITAARGLGIAVVDGRGAVDQFSVSRARPHRVIASRVASKREMWVAAPGHDVEAVAVPEEQRTAPAVTEDILSHLAEAALRVERHMRVPQDIEWAVGHDGQPMILQTRPLQLGPAAQPRATDLAAVRARYRVLLKDQGDVACRGVGSGRVVVVGSDETVKGFEAGDVLVTRHASPRLSALVAGASAVVSDLGAVTGHMATIAREYRVPAIMNTTDATRKLVPGTVVTVDADENVIYAGRVEELLWYELLKGHCYEETPEFRVLRRVLQHIAPLHLRDPGGADFVPERCQTYHDIIRFAHERGLVELQRLEEASVGGAAARTLDLDIPLDLSVIDIGKGTAPRAQTGALKLDEIRSKPLLLILEGLLTPGVWTTSPAEMDLEGFMASATRAGPLTMPGGGAVRRNVAIVARDYANLNLKVGYHFNVVDASLGEALEDNYILFRFVGGVTEVTRRTRRAQLLARILTQYDFRSTQEGELVVARLQEAPRALCEERLGMVGRLIGFSRQLDIVLRDDKVVDALVNSFVSGAWQVDSRTKALSPDPPVRRLV
jgi:pyruvate,water dikinase